MLELDRDGEVSMVDSVVVAAVVVVGPAIEVGLDVMITGLVVEFVIVVALIVFVVIGNVVER